MKPVTQFVLVVVGEITLQLKMLMTTALKKTRIPLVACDSSEIWNNATDNNMIVAPNTSHLLPLANLSLFSTDSSKKIRNFTDIQGVSSQYITL